MTFDTTGEDSSRKVEGLTEVAAKVGGLSHWLHTISGLILLHYSIICFKVDAINSFFNVETEDTSILDNKGDVKVTLLDKLKIFTGCFPKK